MKVLIATDGSEFSRAAIAKFCRMFLLSENTKVKVLSVYEKLAPMATEPFAVSADYYREIEKEEQKQAEKFAAEAAELIHKRFPNAEINTQTLLGRANRTIVETAEDWKADLIAVGSHGYGFWNRALLGSVSDSVLHHALCSVLVVRKSESHNGHEK